jgi:predicted MFS family arabinose efflux permease
VTIGLSIGLGGLGAPLLGLLADARGLTAVFETVAVLPLGALALTLALPRRTPREAVKAPIQARTRLQAGSGQATP